MDRTRITGKLGIMLVFFLFGMTSIAVQQVQAGALLDGMFDGIEEALAEDLAKKGEQLTTGNFYTDDKPNAHAPIGMMGDHTHEAGELMFSYRFMMMGMEETRYGTNRIPTADVLKMGSVPSGYMVAPESMEMMMHMFGFMYGWNDTVTLALMVPYLDISMDHQNRMGTKFTTTAEGFGDLRFGSLWRLWAVEAPSLGAHRFHLNFSVSVPTGSIEPTGWVPLMGGRIVRLPYPMHLGSGTFDFYPGLTYGGEKGRASWGLQAIGTLRGGENSNDFSKGDAYEINAHAAYEFIPNLMSGSVRLSWNDWQEYDGADPAIMTNLPNGQRIVQTAFPSLLGGQRLDILFGTNILFPDFMGLENRLAVEGGLPIYQYLDGQLETDSIITFGWQAVY